ncbi:Plasma membrane t-SNARE, secretory vesicle fusion [Dissophora globulifera]|uniref:Plasma membrane t-SNARE, secretory vesicle fusion n=1 Tax=Dissophora globulifera TaxID=979702 RepID=A0A9P6UQ08_9FUNG|nr:Plasma membrane t-SNARE, secretory vesicle fusion [Dissophora globulifera]
MSRDRLNDYNSNSQSDAYSYPGSNTYGDKQAPVELAPLRGDASLQFFQETEVIQSKMQQFHASINEVEQLFNQNLNSKADPEGAKKLDEKTQSTNSLSNEIYDRLRGKQASFDKRVRTIYFQPPHTAWFLTRDPCRPYHPYTALTTSNMKVRTKEEYEQRKLRTTTLSKQFKDAVARFQGMQYQNRQKSKETVARQLRIANPAATEEDIRRLVDEDQGGAFSQQLLQQARGQQAMAALNSVQSRQRELSSLQQSIVELSQLFTQLEQLISEQDMTFQEIEGNVTRAESDIEKGFGQVGLALKDGISARKKKWMALGIVVVILIIILIIGAAQGWFKKPAA